MPVARIEPVVEPKVPPTEKRLPYLAVARVELPPVPKTEANPVPSPRTKSSVKANAPLAATALAPPRLDLAGFLDDRGLTLTVPSPVESAGEGASEGAGHDQTEALVAPDEPGSFTMSPRTSLSPTPAAHATPPSAPIPVASPAIEVQTFPIVKLGAEAIGAVTMRGDTIHLASLVGLLKLKMSATEFTRLSEAPATDSFVGLDTLQAAGITATLDPSGEAITLSAI